MSRPSKVPDRILELVGEQAMSAQTLAYRAGCSRNSVLSLVRKGLMVKVGETPPERDNIFSKHPHGVAIVCAAKFAHLHKRAA